MKITTTPLEMTADDNHLKRGLATARATMRKFRRKLGSVASMRPSKAKAKVVSKGTAKRRLFGRRK